MTSNSLCCLLQKDPGTTHKGENYGDVVVGGKRTNELISFFPPAARGKKVEDRSAADVKSNNLSLSMLRRDSVGELLVNLPRIESLSQFLYNTYEDSDYQIGTAWFTIVQKKMVKLFLFLYIAVGGKRTGELISFYPSVASGKKVEDRSAIDVKSNDPAPSMSRRDSVGELLVNLPRIASLPQFLYNIYKDFDYQARYELLSLPLSRKGW
ncbi:hypothetical protein BC332_10743 [Capsicum chinense]|nr:hypothetical protein BC332_10743 [Capsicum chinense]